MNDAAAQMLTKLATEFAVERGYQIMGDCNHEGIDPETGRPYALLQLKLNTPFRNAHVVWGEFLEVHLDLILHHQEVDGMSICYLGTF